MIKQMFLIKRKEGISHDDFRKYYLEHHAPIVKEAFPEIIKYVINFIHQGKRGSVYDAITEIYWPDFETLKRLNDSDTYQKKIAPDEKNFISKAGAMIFLAEEFVAKEMKK
jgi:uncharacterized protein (TIGR02118 family)